jgi:hypothetical protein
MLLNDELWISDLAFPVDVKGHLNSLNKIVYSKNNLTKRTFNNIKAF